MKQTTNSTTTVNGERLTENDKRSIIPNIFTLLNLVCGCIAIVYLLQNGIAIVETGATPDNPIGQELTLLPERIYLAPLFIALAAVVDFFDGFIARAMGASSEMGKQLDSLADVVSFGVAPAIIIYQLLRLSIAKEEDGLEASMLWLAPAFVLAAAAAYRLAKFNLDTRQTYSFRGTPVPAVGIAVASFPLIYWTSNTEWVLNLLTNKWFLYAVIIFLSWLMVSDIPIMSNKPKSKTVQGLLPQLSLLVVGIIAVLLLGWLSVPIIFISFVILSLIFKKQLE
jgi:CDP-diacylglycerol--serine O-phosphatidyltransferase